MMKRDFFEKANNLSKGARLNGIEEVMGSSPICSTLSDQGVGSGHLYIMLLGSGVMEKIIAVCGNDCSACPRYTVHPYEKTEEQLRHTAELWMKIGYRDHLVSNEEIACSGCKPENWCRYGVAKCCEAKGISNCSECNEYPCDNMKECFEVTKSFEPMCRKVCTASEYEMLKRAFFEKEMNLS